MGRHGGVLMKRTLPVLALAALLAAGCTSGAASGGSGATSPAAGVTSVAGEASQSGGCTQSVETTHGLIIQNQTVVGQVDYSCTGTVTAFKLTLILIHDGTYLKPGNSTDDTPAGDGVPYKFVVQAPCQEGTWELYMIVAWTVNGVTGYNPQTNFGTETFSAGDCQI